MSIENHAGLLCESSNDGKPRALGYVFKFNGHGAFTPNGQVELTDEQIAAHNEALANAELAGLDANCEIGQRGSFYIIKRNGRTEVTTWTGALVSAAVSVNGRSLTFRRAGKVYRGRTSRLWDLFNFRRVA